jgi:hypothetical protein
MSKRIIISAEELASLGIDQDPEIYLRFRLVSEDRNRLSAWTPIFEIPTP